MVRITINSIRLSITLLLSSCLLMSAAQAAPLRFTLNEAKMGEVTEKNWADQYLFIAIGYTSCPEICPTTALDMAGVMTRLGKFADKVTPLFISIDPHRDSAENIAQYVQYFHPKLKGLVGDEQQTKAMAKSLRATYGYSRDGKPVYPPLPQLYEVFHSTYLYLYNPQRELVDVYGYGDGAEKISQSMLAELGSKEE
ncbi:SCO family protein [Vibrio ponticus]|uniref:SCO family protein n=1 Tax=Vibrio ponticus TaxID=265668 RepID=A0A3N3E626_9VIBR|nr:SCO family protein [Vibrio ponticus]ROV62195.1 SCO family protein [Vibrio ponticus]